MATLAEIAKLQEQENPAAVPVLGEAITPSSFWNIQKIQQVYFDSYQMVIRATLTFGVSVK